MGGGEGPSPLLNPRTSAPSRTHTATQRTADWAAHPAWTIIPDWIQVAFPPAIITDSWSILRHYHRTLPQTHCQHASLGRGACMCDHWGGKEPWPGTYTVQPQRGEPFEQSLNPGGLKVWLAMLLSILGHNLKGDQSAVPQNSKALFLPPHLSLLPLSLPVFSYKPSFVSLWNLDENCTVCEENI